MNLLGLNKNKTTIQYNFTFSFKTDSNISNIIAVTILKQTVDDTVFRKCKYQVGAMSNRRQALTIHSFWVRLRRLPAATAE